VAITVLRQSIKFAFLSIILFVIQRLFRFFSRPTPPPAAVSPAFKVRSLARFLANTAAHLDPKGPEVENVFHRLQTATTKRQLRRLVPELLRVSHNAGRVVGHIQQAGGSREVARIHLEARAARATGWFGRKQTITESDVTEYLEQHKQDLRQAEKNAAMTRALLHELGVLIDSMGKVNRLPVDNFASANSHAS
jgi:hypothetical protein